MPVYVFREGQSNRFKIGLAADVEKRRRELQTGNSQPLVVFAVIDTENASACEAFFKRHVQSKKVCGGSTEFFEFEEEATKVKEIVTRLKALFEEIELTRKMLGELELERKLDAPLEPTSEDEDLVRRWLAKREQQELLNVECELIEAQLKTRIGRTSGIRGLVTWLGSVRKNYDENLFRQRDPDQYERVFQQYHCVDTTAWKADSPKDYTRIQQTFFSETVCKRKLNPKVKS